MSCVYNLRSVKNNTKPQPRDKNLMYKKAKVELSSAVVSQDEYEFQVETPEGMKKKPQKRQPRLKNTMRTFWGLKIQPTIASKDFVPRVKKTVAPLQARTGNTLCPIETLNVVSAHDNHSDIVVSNFDGKKNAEKSISKSSKCVQLKNKQTDEEAKENIPLVKKKASDSSGFKYIVTPLKERMAHFSNSTPVRSGITPPTINNMPEILSPIHGDHADQSMKSTPQRNSIHQSSKIDVPVVPAPSTWRLGSTVRYDLNFNANIDNCFGFDDENTDPIDVIQPNKLIVPDLICSQNIRQPKNKPCNQFHQGSLGQPLTELCPQPEKKQGQKRPSNLSQTKPSTRQVKKPINKKTTDTSEIKENEENMTSSKHLPTLFDDLQKDDLYKSPFSEPPRRTYARMRPMRRLVHVDEEEEEESKKPTVSKRNKTVHKRKKMVQTTMLDQWIKEVNNHFAEVDKTDLIIE